MFVWMDIGIFPKIILIHFFNFFIGWINKKLQKNTPCFLWKKCNDSKKIMLDIDTTAWYYSIRWISDICFLVIFYYSTPPLRLSSKKCIYFAIHGFFIISRLVPWFTRVCVPRAFWFYSIFTFRCPKLSSQLINNYVGVLSIYVFIHQLCIAFSQ